MEVIFKSPPPLTPSRQCRPCVCARECVSYSFQALLGFTGVWTAGRGALIGQNDAEMDRKPPLEFLKLIFSRPHFYTLTPFQSLTPPPPHHHPLPFFSLNALFFISIALRSQPRLSNSAGVAPLIFHIPFIPAIRPFPKSTLSQQGEAFSR